MDLGLEGRTAIVAAATSGLGRAIAQTLSVEGANVVLFGRRGDLAEEIASALPSAVGVTGDLMDPGTPERVTEVARQKFGSVDIFVWNSGGPPAGRMMDLDVDSLRAAETTVVEPFIRFLHILVPDMRSERWGRIVAIGSSGVQQPIPNLALSNVARASVGSICKTLAGEVASDGVTVNMILPGRIATDRVASLDAAHAEREGITPAEVAERSQSKIPAGRYGTPQEFAAVAAFLCSESASYMTGSQVRVDGGLIASIH